MKGIFKILGILFVLFSCDVKDNKKQNQEVESKTFKFTNNDVDFDGIENKSDKDPFVSTFPRVELIDVESIKISYAYKNSVEPFHSKLNYGAFDKEVVKFKRQNYLKYKLVNLHYRKSVLFDQSYDESEGIDHTHFNSFVLTTNNTKFFNEISEDLQANEDNFKEKSGSIFVSFKIALKNLEKIYNIKDIKISFHLHDVETGDFRELGSTILKDEDYKNVSIDTNPDEDFYGVTVFRIPLNNLDQSTLEDFSKKHIDLIARVDNFTFKREGKELNYKNQIEKAVNNLTNLVIYEPNEISQTFASKSLLLDAINQRLNLGFEILEDGIIDRIEQRNTLFHPFNLNTLSSEQLKSGLWEVVGLNDLKGSLNQIKNVFLIYARGFELKNLTNERFSPPTVHKKSDEILEIDGLMPDSILNVELEAEEKHHSIKISKKRAECLIDPANDYDDPNHRGAPYWTGCNARVRVQAAPKSYVHNFSNSDPLVEFELNPILKHQDKFQNQWMLSSKNKIKFQITVFSQFLKDLKHDLPLKMQINFKRNPSFSDGHFLGTVGSDRNNAIQILPIIKNHNGIIGQENHYSIKMETIGIHKIY